MSQDYNYYVTEGRKLVHAIDVYQATIAYYASMVCEIRHGGRSNGRYTLSQYAKDIGVHRKKLSDWSLTYRQVITKLDIELKDITRDDWKVATRVSNILRAEKRAIQAQMGMKRKKGRAWDIAVEVPVERIRDLFNLNKKHGRCPQALLTGYTDTVLGIKGKLRQMDLSEMNPVILAGLKSALDEASTELTQHLLHRENLAATMEIHNVAIQN